MTTETDTATRTGHSTNPARPILVAGVLLLLFALIGLFVNPALMGQQPNDAMASIPTWVLSLLGFVFSISQLLGSALIAAAVAVKALSRNDKTGSAS